jgi:cold shock protein
MSTHRLYLRAGRSRWPTTGRDSSPPSDVLDRRQKRATARRFLVDGFGQTRPMTSVGSVRHFDADEGWGVIDGPDVPGGCWVHFSVIAVDGYRALARGQRVSFRAEIANQDGFAYRAVKVWTDAVEPADQPCTPRSSAAYSSTLTLTFDPPRPDGVTEPEA